MTARRLKIAHQGPIGVILICLATTHKPALHTQTYHVIIRMLVYVWPHKRIICSHALLRVEFTIAFRSSRAQIPTRNEHAGRECNLRAAISSIKSILLALCICYTDRVQIPT